MIYLRRESAISLFFLPAFFLASSQSLAAPLPANITVIATAAAAAADMFSNATCTEPMKRKEWYIPNPVISLWFRMADDVDELCNPRRTLLRQEKKEYIDAVLCLQRKPSGMKSTIPGAATRFDDFQGVHILHMETVHLNVGFYI